MIRTLNQVHDFLYRDTFWLELVSTALLFVWTLVLIMPPPTFSASSAYSTMAVWLPEYGWALVAFLFGCISLYGLKKQVRIARRVSLLGGVFFWGTIGFSIVFSSVASTGGWVYVTIGTLCAGAFVFGKN